MQNEFTTLAQLKYSEPGASWQGAAALTDDEIAFLDAIIKGKYKVQEQVSFRIACSAYMATSLRVQGTSCHPGCCTAEAQA